MKKHRKEKYSLDVKRGSSGLGLFAAEDIKKGSFVIEYYGPLITTEKSSYVGGKYLFEVNSNWVINGSPRYNIARYINHSCIPNCETDIKGKRVYISAIRNIQKGIELSYDYGKEYFDEYIKNVCRCPRCTKKKKNNL